MVQLKLKNNLSQYLSEKHNYRWIAFEGDIGLFSRTYNKTAKNPSYRKNKHFLFELH